MFRGVLQAHTGEQANSYPRKGPVRLTDANRGVGLRARGFRPSYPTQASKQEKERERERKRERESESEREQERAREKHRETESESESERECVSACADICIILMQRNLGLGR